MVVVIGAAALGGRTAGVYTALSAALAFNFWHTKPYLSLRVHDVADIITTVLLLVAGLLVGALATARQEQATAASDERGMLTVLAILTDLLAAGASVDEVWAVTRRALVEQVHLAAARFEPFGTEAPPLPRMTSAESAPREHGADVAVLRLGRRGFLLPAGGVEIALMRGEEPVGRLVLEPAAGNEGVPVTARQFALTVAEQFSVVAAGGARRTLF